MEHPADGPGLDAAASKSALRARIRAARATLSPETIARRAAAMVESVLDEVPASSLVFGYLPMPGEPDLRPAMSAHLARGGAVLVPRILPGAERALAWVSWSPEVETVRSAHAPVQEPVGEAADIQTRLREHAAASRHPHLSDHDEPLAVMLIPALAVDAHGVRLGQGGGCYDRLVAGLTAAPGPPPPAVARWAVVHAAERLPAGAFPGQAHDLRATRVLTEGGIESIGA